MSSINCLYLQALQEKQPILAIHLMAYDPQPGDFKKPQQASHVPLESMIDQATAWFACSMCIENSQAIQQWLNQNTLHRLSLLFQNVPELYDWLLQSHVASLVLHPQVQLFCMEGIGQESESLVRQAIWDTPGFAIACYDPYHRFEELQAKIAAWSFQRRAVTQELLHYGRWNWPNILRRLLGLNRERTLTAQQVWSGVPVLICGAGPSLTDQAQVLQKYRDHFFIISAGTGINVLERLKVKPHLAMSVDPFRAQFSRFCLVQNLEQLHGAGWRSNYRALSCLTGPRLLIPGSEAYPIVEHWQQQLRLESPSLDEGHNVVGMALSTACALDSSCIGIAGVDLAFSNGQLYGGSFSSTERSLLGFSTIEEPPIQAPGIDGKTIVTLAKWLAEAQWLSKFAQESRVPVYRFANQGLAINGITHKRLEDVANLLPQRDYDAWSWSWYQELPSAAKPEQTYQILQDLMQNLQEAKQQMLVMKDALQEMIQDKGIDPQRGPTFEQIATDLPIDVEVQWQEFQWELEALKVYPLILRIWDQCYQRVFGCGFEQITQGRLCWLQPWFLLRRLQFLIQGVDYLYEQCLEAEQGQSHVSNEV